MEEIYERIKKIEERLNRLERKDMIFKPIHIEDKNRVKVNLFSDEELEKLFGERSK